MSAPADDAGKQVASGGEEEELNDAVEVVGGEEVVLRQKNDYDRRQGVTARPMVVAKDLTHNIPVLHAWLRFLDFFLEFPPRKSSPLKNDHRLLKKAGS